MPKRGDHAVRETEPGHQARSFSTARRWSRAEKAAIVEESFLQGNSVTSVARKYQVSAVSLYQWRKKFPAGIMAMIGRAESLTHASATSLQIARAGSPGNRPVSAVEAGEGDPAAELARLRREVARYRSRHAALVALLKHLSMQLQHLAELDALQDLDDSHGSPVATEPGANRSAPTPRHRGVTD